MSDKTNFADIRRQFTEEWMRAGSCSIPLCTEIESCGQLGHLLDKFGLVELRADSEGFSDRRKEFVANEILQTILSESGNLGDWSSSLFVLNMLRWEKAWLSDTPLKGFQEVPESIWNVIQDFRWETFFIKMKSMDMSPDERKSIELMFMRSFVEALFPDEVLAEIESRSGNFQ